MKIFSFPYVVINELMKHLTPVEQLRLSFCSKNAHAFVKTYSNTNRDLCIKLSGYYNGYSIFYPKVFLINVSSYQPGCLETSNLKTAHGFKYGFNKSRHFIIYCDDVVQEYQGITNYICDLFKTPVANIAITHESDQWLLDFAQRRQELPLKKVHTWNIGVSADFYSRIMSCNMTELLECDMIPPDNFRFDAKLPAVKNLIIKNGLWITREHLLGLESQNTHLFYTQLTSLDINVLLRSWLNGGLPNLKYLKIYDRTLDNQFYEGIHDRLKPVRREISYKGDDDMRPFQFNTNAFHIRRDDGVVATVTLDGHWFVMAVWPDFNGNRVKRFIRA